MNELRGWALSYAQGNPGAMQCLIEVTTMKGCQNQTLILDGLRRMESIRGTNLYVLYSDLADRNLDKMAELIEKVPSAELEDACNRQDYSGRKIVSKYLKF